RVVMKLVHHLLRYVLISTFLVGSATTGITAAQAPPATADAPARPHQLKCPKWYNGDHVLSCWLTAWHPTGQKASIPNKIGNWQDCGFFTPSMYPGGTMHCRVSKSTSTTRSNTVTVSAGIDINIKDIIDISASIKKVTHYSITHKTTVSAWADKPVPGPYNGSIQWAAVWGHRYRVQLKSTKEAYYVTDSTSGAHTLFGRVKPHYSYIDTGEVLNAAAYRVVYDKWKATADASYQYYRIGGWQTCARFSRKAHSRNITCRVDTKVSTEPSPMSAVRISLKEMSRLVGYDVRHTTTVRIHHAVNVDAHKSGRVEWAPGFGSRKVIHENLYQCIRNRCTLKHNQPQKTVTVEKYSGNEYRVVNN
ncbi:MAG TPA: hypothetical protein VFH39_01330, partial [Candidatus Saccharimonadales bacterium]|nr:hypothetical protein [Candidatus Saccharimonadales bacterium]